MPTTHPLTMQDFSNKFAAYTPYITPVVLSLINRSETFKSLIREYQSSAFTIAVKIDTDPKAGSYSTPNGTNKGELSIGVNFLQNEKELIRVLSHESDFLRKSPNFSLTWLINFF